MDPTSAETPVFSASAPRFDAARRAALARANACMLTFAVAALGWEWLGLPLLLRATHEFTFALAVTLIPVVLATPIHWGLVHEGIHGQLLRERRANEALARALAIGLALPFDAVRFGHLMHHRFTREPFDRPDVIASRGSRWRRRVAYYARLLGGFYLMELVLPLLAFLPKTTARAIVARGVGAQGESGVQVQRLFANHAADPVRRRRARRDWLLSLALYAMAFALYGRYGCVLLVAMSLRGLWLSLADNLPHYDVALDEPGRARDFRVPRALGVLLMNHHLHRQHHLHPTLPWTALPALASIDDKANDKANVSARTPYLAAVLRQFRGMNADVSGTEVPRAIDTRVT
ncbi:fatty acid desaturase [Paraburkholderia acidisoli]|uniref:Fatty acid desaturase n=1 Tax=Paraburkholderia acidisoli TaxID=2571748 RepID=A0A7Z2JEC0_9BURK|nr:fatty acid desaturase [Paraburkholderia acidisoli]QGZ60309.1 fatty acid desaturase [Paraburkholderia acidisoli]